MNGNTKVERVIKHFEATVELYYSSIIEVIIYKENEYYWSKLILGSRRGKRYPLRYTFRSYEERELFLDTFIKAYPDVPIVDTDVN